MTGQDAERAGCTAKIDVYPISNTGEIQALISGRMTYFLRWISGRARYEIDARDSLDITAHPADDVDADTRIVVEHRCGYPRVEAARYISRPARKADTNTFPADPPF